MILLDTSGLFSALDESQRHHPECARLIGEASSPLLLSPFVLAERDYLLMRHVGRHAQLALPECFFFFEKPPDNCERMPTAH